MKFTAHASFEIQVVRLARGGGGDRRWIFRVEVTPPVDMVAQEFDDQFFKQTVVFSVRTKEAGVKGVVVRGRLRWPATGAGCGSGCAAAASSTAARLSG